MAEHRRKREELRKTEKQKGPGYALGRFAAGVAATVGGIVIVMLAIAAVERLARTLW